MQQRHSEFDYRVEAKRKHVPLRAVRQANELAKQRQSSRASFSLRRKRESDQRWRDDTDKYKRASDCCEPGWPRSGSTCDGRRRDPTHPTHEESERKKLEE